MFKFIEIDQLTPLENNPRCITEKQMQKLCQSISDNKDYFQARPIIVSNRTGKLIILAGNQRYNAAKIIDLKKVPIFILENLTIEKEREIIIRDNISNGEWDYELLANEWDYEELQEWGLNIPVDFKIEDEVDGLINENVIPTIKDAITKLGDIWVLGKHRVACGDCTDTDIINKLMKNKKADIVFTSPPYNIGKTPNGNDNKYINLINI